MLGLDFEMTDPGICCAPPPPLLPLEPFLLGEIAPTSCCCKGAMLLARAAVAGVVPTSWSPERWYAARGWFELGFGLAPPSLCLGVS
jgi:hypothetical protein